LAATRERERARRAHRGGSRDERGHDEDDEDDGHRTDEKTHRTRSHLQRRREEEAERERAARAAVTRYKNRWFVLQAGVGQKEAEQGGLRFTDVPWPVLGQPEAPGDIDVEKVEAFVRAGGMPDRVRWHPDRFGRLWGRVREEERAEISKGVVTVARCLLELSEKL
ncbi:uncharacterized protein BXZ73DRAFT_47326, partial [Epithele typhae]|uniref:uncharacterized protein n=1 Tax=Epithele typhae TaxID=378194 RepID=UPI002008CF0B